MPIRRIPSPSGIDVAWNWRKKYRQRKILPRSLTLRKSLCRRSRCSLLKRILPLGSKAFATLSSSRSNYGASAPCCHAGSKSEFACTFNLGGSVGRFHLLPCLILDLEIQRKGEKGKWVYAVCQGFKVTIFQWLEGNNNNMNLLGLSDDE
jgi:hypothetical protein